MQFRFIPMQNKRAFRLAEFSIRWTSSWPLPPAACEGFLLGAEASLALRGRDCDRLITMRSRHVINTRLTFFAADIALDCALRRSRIGEAAADASRKNSVTNRRDVPQGDITNRAFSRSFRAAGVEVSDVVGLQAWASRFACPRAALKAITCRSSRSD